MKRAIASMLLAFATTSVFADEKAVPANPIPVATPVKSIAAASPTAQAPVRAPTSNDLPGTEPNTEVKIEPVAAPAPVVKKRRPAALPGVRRMASNSKLMRGSVIRTTGDGTETALISMRFPNRIATPFDHPRVIDSSVVTMQVDGSSIFINPKDEVPFAIFITGNNPGDPVISLTLIPKDIPAQTISLQIDSSQGAARKAPRVESYTQQVVELLRTVASGKAPEGFSEGVMPNIVVKQQQDGLVILPMVRYSGSSMDIYKYRVENNQEDIELSETSFYQKGVRAVSIFPNAILRKGESTTVFVLADKSLLDGENDGR